VLPGTSDHELANNQFARNHLEALGVTFASDLILQVATADGVREHRRSRPVTAASTVEPRRRRLTAPTPIVSKIPTRLPRFVASRVLYRRLAGWVWFPFIALLLFDLSWRSLNAQSSFTSPITDLHVHTPHTASFWDNLLVNLLILGGVEFVVVCCAGLIVRRRFDRDARRSFITRAQ
jgi:hypothetical protein